MNRPLRLSDRTPVEMIRNATAAVARLIGNGPAEAPATLAEPAPAIADIFFPEECGLPRMIYPGARVEQRYWIEEEIGVGGLCFVHRVRDEQTGQAHALKTLQPSFADMPFYFAMMTREAETQGLIQHPHILSIDRLISSDGGRHALLLPYLAGGTLSDRMRRNGPLAPLDCVKLLKHLLDALACLRRSDITHLDIAPDNIMFENGDIDSVRLIDFGLSRRLAGSSILPGEENLFLGKTSWACPEMLTGGEITPDSDLFGLGLVMLFAATGTVPTAPCGMNDGEGTMSDALPPSHAELKAPIEAMLDLDPGKRPAVYDLAEPLFERSFSDL